MASRGIFITFEGGEGCGKTTQIQLLKNSLLSKKLNEEIIVTREPGGIPAAELIRDLLVNGDAKKWRPASEALLMSAARHEHVEKMIRPALAKNKIVISDRFFDSMVVYQGIVGGLASQDIEVLNKISCNDICPDLTIILDVESQIALTRAQLRGFGESRFEAKGATFHKNVRTGFINLAAMYKERCVIIDGDRRPNEVAYDVLELALVKLRARGMIADG